MSVRDWDSYNSNGASRRTDNRDDDDMDFDRYQSRRGSGDNMNFDPLAPSPARSRNRMVEREASSTMGERYTASSANVVICKPQTFKDVQGLIDNLRRKEPLIFNLEGISNESAQRILDFMSGASYALGGSMKRIKEYLFLVTPEGVSITVPAE